MTAGLLWGHLGANNKQWTFEVAVAKLDTPVDFEDGEQERDACGTVVGSSGDRVR